MNFYLLEKQLWVANSKIEALEKELLEAKKELSLLKHPPIPLGWSSTNTICTNVTVLAVL